MGRYRSWKSTWLAASVLGVSALVASGCGEAPATDSPTAVAPRFASTSGAKIAVTVTSNGAPVVGAVVVAFNAASGPFKLDGTFADTVTDSKGNAILSGLPSGNYCVTARGVPLSAFAGGNRSNPLSLLVPPASSPQNLDPTSAYVGGISSSSKTAVAFTASNWVTYCQNTPPIALNGSANVALPLPATPPASLGYFVKDLTGTLRNVPAWAAAPLPKPYPAWITALGLPPDAVPSLLVSTIPTGLNTAVGLADNTSSVTIQTVLFDAGAGQGLLTGTVHGHGSFDPNAPLADGSAQSLVCKVSTSNEPSGDQSGTLDIAGLGPNQLIKAGFGTNTSLQAVDTTRFALWYQQSGAGTETLQMRFVGGNVAGLQVDYVCSAGSCSITGQRGSGVGVVTPAIFGEDLGNGWTRVNWVITNVQAGVTAVDLQLQGTSDTWPNSSKSNQVAAYYRLYVPSGGCDGGLGSDDRIWIN